MNATERIKPKTIRLAILLALADGEITTIDDLQIKIDEPRKKVAGAVYPAATEGLIKRLRDDVTGAPAYQITATGREYLAKYAGAVDEPAPVTATPAADDTARQHSEVAALGALETALPGFTAGVVAQKDEEIGRLTRMFHAAVVDIARISDALDIDPDDAGGAEPIVQAIGDLRATIKAKNELVVAYKEAIGGKLDYSAAGYVMQRPTKPLVRFVKAEKAQARALSFARAGHRVQVFALVPVGAAVPGAEWVAA